MYIKNVNLTLDFKYKIRKCERHTRKWQRVSGLRPSETQNSKSRKENKDKRKSSCQARDTINRAKRWLRDWEGNYFPSDHLIKDCHVEHVRELHSCVNKQDTLEYWQPPYLDKLFFKEYTQLCKCYMKRYSNALLIKEIDLKPQQDIDWLQEKGQL